MDQPRFRVLDGWRGVCALMVALFHLPVFGHFYSLPLIRHGYLFVDFFFVLSGFVITHAYADRVKAGGSWLFLGRRIGRLWPLHLAILGGFILLEAIKWLLEQRGITYGRAAWTRDGDPSAILTNVALIHAWGLHPYATWNNPSWSISVEWAAYLAFAATLSRAPRSAAWVAGGVALLSLFVLGVIAPSGMESTFDYGLARCGLGFALGHLAYLLWSRTGSLRWPGAAEASALAAAASLVCFSSATWVSLLAPVGFAAVVYVFAFQSGGLSRLMDCRPLHALGDWSYSLYMLQALALAVIVPGTVIGAAALQLRDPISAHAGKMLLDFGSPWVGDLLAAAFLAALIAASALSYRVVELPGQRVFRRWLKPRPRRMRHDVHQRRADGTLLRERGSSGP